MKVFTAPQQRWNLPERIVDEVARICPAKIKRTEAQSTPASLRQKNENVLGSQPEFGCVLRASHADCRLLSFSHFEKVIGNFQENQVIFQPLMHRRQVLEATTIFLLCNAKLLF